MWVLRGENGDVLLHSRRAFTNIRSRDEAKRISVVWAIESVISHRVNHVFFALEDLELVGAVLKPNMWPSFRYQTMELLSLLSLI